ncbi:MAG TPA: hypothetical protein VGM67_06295 [Gemmatimonadaceae bacterium]|jgi:hypothetical protein
MRQKAGGADNDTLSPDFLDFIVSLNEHKVDFVLVGGYALAVHGVVRATGGIDFLYRATKRNVRRLCNAMIDFGAPPEIIDEETLLQPGIVTQFGQPPYRIDLLNEIDGVTFAAVWQGALTTSIEREDVRVIGLKELKANKAATGRKKDNDDVRRLESRRR